MIQNNEHIEPLRVTRGKGASDASYGNNGFFIWRTKNEAGQNVAIKIMASDSMGWEHVSVSIHGKQRCPTWDEMDKVKNLFWAEDECVIQYHPPLDQYINHHPYVLHLWKPVGVDLPLPPSSMVGYVKKERS